MEECPARLGESPAARPRPSRGETSLRLSSSTHHRRPYTQRPPRNHSMQSHPTNATQAKDRHYMQLSNSLARLSQAVGHTADLCELLKSNLDAMRTLASSHAAQCVAPHIAC